MLRVGLSKLEPPYISPNHAHLHRPRPLLPLRRWFRAVCRMLTNRRTMSASTNITRARGRRLIKFRNCFCGVQAVKFMDGSFLCRKHWEMDRARTLQDPHVTAYNIKECNARCERERSARLKAKGLCVTCGKLPNYTGCTRCESCQAKRRALQASYRGKSQSTIHPWRK